MAQAPTTDGRRGAKTYLTTRLDDCDIDTTEFLESVRPYAEQELEETVKVEQVRIRDGELVVTVSAL